MLVLGIDDAGRGPLIGPMFLAGALLEAKEEEYLKHEGVADSKTLAHSTRVKLAGMIKDHCKKYKVVKAEAGDIDHALATGVNLNTLEAIKCADIISDLLIGIDERVKVIVDCPSVNTVAWKATLQTYLKKEHKIELHCEHKADANHASVSAASILAKVAREEAVTELKKTYGDMGSGYPSDPSTVAFVKKYGQKYKDAGIFRKSWATWKQLFPSVGQSTLGAFKH